MSKFTPEERQLISHYASYSDSPVMHVLDHATYLAPGVLIVSYGLYIKSPLAVAVGAGAILLYQGLRITRELRYVKLLKSVFVKVQEMDSANGSAP